MIKIKNTDVYGFEAAIRGMRNPWNSWEKSDSVSSDVHNCVECAHKEDFSVCYPNHIYNCFDIIIGENDLALMKKLVSAGTDHSKFMRMINVTCDITAPMYWWKEFDTYKVGTVRNSCSTMHTITEKEFTLDDFSHEHLVPEAVDFLTDIVDMLNDARYAYVNWDTEKDKICIDIDDKKDLWWHIIQLASENPNAHFDGGFKVFKIDKTKDGEAPFAPHTGIIGKQEFFSTILNHAGLPADTPLTEINICGARFWSANSGRLIFADEAGTTIEQAQGIISLKPEQIVLIKADADVMVIIKKYLNKHEKIHIKSTH